MHRPKSNTSNKKSNSNTTTTSTNTSEKSNPSSSTSKDSRQAATNNSSSHGNSSGQPTKGTVGTDLSSKKGTSQSEKGNHFINVNRVDEDDQDIVYDSPIRSDSEESDDQNDSYTGTNDDNDDDANNTDADDDDDEIAEEIAEQIRQQLDEEQSERANKPSKPLTSIFKPPKSAYKKPPSKPPSKPPGNTHSKPHAQTQFTSDIDEVDLEVVQHHEDVSLRIPPIIFKYVKRELTELKRKISHILRLAMIIDEFSAHSDKGTIPKSLHTRTKLNLAAPELSARQEVINKTQKEYEQKMFEILREAKIAENERCHKEFIAAKKKIFSTVQAALNQVDEDGLPTPKDEILFQVKTWVDNKLSEHRLTIALSDTLRKHQKEEMARAKAAAEINVEAAQNEENIGEIIRKEIAKQLGPRRSALKKAGEKSTPNRDDNRDSRKPRTKSRSPAKKRSQSPRPRTEERRNKPRQPRARQRSRQDSRSQSRSRSNSRNSNTRSSSRSRSTSRPRPNPRNNSRDNRQRRSPNRNDRSRSRPAARNVRFDRRTKN